MSLLSRVSNSGRTARPALSSSQLSSKGKPTSFRAIISRIFNIIYTNSVLFYKRFKSLLWVGSTGLIFLLIPIMYSKVIETEMEFMKLERASDIAAGRAGGAMARSF